MGSHQLRQVAQMAVLITAMSLITALCPAKPPQIHIYPILALLVPLNIGRLQRLVAIKLLALVLVLRDRYSPNCDPKQEQVALRFIHNLSLLNQHCKLYHQDLHHLRTHLIGVQHRSNTLPPTQIPQLPYNRQHLHSTVQKTFSHL